MQRFMTDRRVYVVSFCVFAVFFSSAGMLAQANAAVVSIYDLQSTVDGTGGSTYDGQEVTVTGTVTVVFHFGYVLAEAAGPWRAVYVYSRANAPEIGDEVRVTGVVDEYFGMTEIVDITSYEHLSSGLAVSATTVSVAEAGQELYESVLISVEDVTVTDLLADGEWRVTDAGSNSILCDDNNDYMYFPELGDTLDSITGVLFYTYSNFKIEPRATSDIVTGEPAPHYVLYGDVVTMNDTRDVIEDAYVEILDDEIVAVHLSGPFVIPVVDVGGLIFPGLIDSHNHHSYNVLGTIPFQQLFTERSEWRSHPLNSDFNNQWSDIRNYGGASAHSANIRKLAEVRALTAGTTSIQGANCNGDGSSRYARQGIVINNVERFPARAYHDTFPLTRDSSFWDEKNAEYWDRFLIHLSEGISPAALDEFATWQSMGMLDARTTIIHGVPYGAAEWAAMAAADANIVWSPTSNLILYGATADIPGALAAGVNVALAPDWRPSGGRHVLDELKEADRHNRDEWADVITPLQFAEFVTRNAAKAMGIEGFVGQIAPGYRANLMVIPGNPLEPYDALLAADPADVKLTVVDGRPMYGNPGMLAAFSFVSGVETIYVDGVAKGLAIQLESEAVSEANKPFSQIVAELEEAYLASDPKLCDFLGYEFSSYYDWDEDGMSDVYEVGHGFDPDDDDEMGDDFSAGPDGTPDGRNDWDGDGMSNSDEYTFGYDATDPNSWAEVPLLPIVGCSVLVVLLLTVSLVAVRGFKRREA